MRGVPPSTAEEWADVRERLREARIDPRSVDVVLLDVGIGRDEAIAMLRSLLAEDRAALASASLEDRARLAGIVRIMAGKAISLYQDTAARSRSGTGRVSLLQWSLKLLSWSAALNNLPSLEPEVEPDENQGVRIGPPPKRGRGRPKGSKTKRAKSGPTG